MASPAKRPRRQSPSRNEDPATTSSSSPYVSMFQTFRAELDEHHDRRERVIKASRDITALSKKVIFSLQRARSLPSPLPKNIIAENTPRRSTITDSLTTLLASDLAGTNAWRYQRQISPGMQEWVEAAVFQRYLETQTLLTVDEARKLLPEGMLLTDEDWLLGVFDAVGEMMRFGITGMAVGGKVLGGKGTGQETEKGEANADEMEIDSKGEERNMLVDLRLLRSLLERLETRRSGWDLSKKIPVMKTCVEKVENAVYGMIVRGRERPKGWVPEGREQERQMEAVESY